MTLIFISLMPVKGWGYYFPKLNHEVHFRKNFFISQRKNFPHLSKYIIKEQFFNEK